MASFTIKILENNKKIQTLITKALKKDIDKKMVQAANKMVRPIRILVRTSLNKQPEYIELDNGILAAHFGLPDGRNRIDRIIDTWVNNITVRTKKSFFRQQQISSGLSVGIVKRDYSDVLSEAASIVTTNKGQPLPWLEWLLKFGDQTIIRDFDISFNPIGRSRSGLAIMIQEPGGRWGVPPQFAGTATNNFATRALDDASDKLIDIIINSLKSTLRF